MAKSKLQQAYADKLDREQQYNLTEAVKLMKGFVTSKFDETIEVALNLNVDPKQADQMVRSTVLLPNGSGKTIRVAVVTKGDKQEEAKKAGADIVGAEDLIAQIKKDGGLNVDRLIASPDCMPLIGQVGKILGPKGLMPNPKVGTVTNDIGKAVENAKGGQIEFRVEKNGILHVGVGKKSFTEKKIEENIRAFVDAVKAVKPSGVKGVYMAKMAISSTMGPGIKIDISELR